MDAFTRFERVRELGAGASGTVYEVIDRADGARVALKVLRHPTTDGLRRFEDEFRALRRVEHPNLVRLRELVAAEDGECFFTMELVPGGDFHTFVGRDERRLRAAFLQLAEALAALHARGRVHRDLKPSNVRVRPDGRVVILDFGLVLEVQERLRSSVAVVLGTPAYMAPEQASCGDVGPAADWYAAGAMLFQALTGKLPFDGSMFEMLDVRRRARPPRASEHAPDVPPDLDRLCTDLLRADPCARPSGQDVLARLTHVAQLDERRRAPSLPGRESELEILARTVERARRGELTAANVLGPSRSGKTAILNVAATTAACTPRTAVLTARCQAGERVPYAALDGIVDSLTRVVAEMSGREQRKLVSRDAPALAAAFPLIRRIPAFRDVRAAVPPDLDRALSDGLVHVLRGLAAHRTVVLCIDDLQHGDAAGMRVLNAILQDPAAPAMAVLLASRELPKLHLPYRVLRVPVGNDPSYRIAV